MFTTPLLHSCSLSSSNLASGSRYKQLSSEGSSDLQILALLVFLSTLWDKPHSQDADCYTGNTTNVQLIICHYPRGSDFVRQDFFSRPLHSFIIPCFVWMWLPIQQHEQLLHTCRPMQRSAGEHLCNDSVLCTATAIAASHLTSSCSLLPFLHSTGNALIL